MSNLLKDESAVISCIVVLDYRIVQDKVVWPKIGYWFGLVNSKKLVESVENQF